MATEHAQYYSRPDVYGLQFIHARFVTHRFARHVHDYFVIGIIEDGLQTFSYRGAKQGTAQGGIILLNPDEPHTGEAATGSGFVYKALYPSPELMSRVSSDVAGVAGVQRFFSSPIVYDKDLAQRLLQLHHVLVRDASTLEGESLALHLFAQLLMRYGDGKLSATRSGQERTAVLRAREYLEAHYARNVSLVELAQYVALSPFHLTRVFKQTTGLPPHAYLESIRIRRAQQLLKGDLPVIEVALATGFADQSHFTHRFRRFVGVTPAHYQKMSKITQD
jgi:AraC-like DNA-binding protein